MTLFLDIHCLCFVFKILEIFPFLRENGNKHAYPTNPQMKNIVNIAKLSEDRREWPVGADEAGASDQVQNSFSRFFLVYTSSQKCTHSPKVSTTSQ